MKVIKKIIKPIKTLHRWISRKQRLIALQTIANLRIDETCELSPDESVLLNTFAELLMPSLLVTRNGKIVYAAPTLEDITLWQMVEARRAESATALITGWCGDRAYFETVTDVIKLSKFIKDELKRSDDFEKALLPSAGQAQESDNPLEEAKNILGLVQITAELFACSFEEAKQVNYTDAILAISKRHDEVEKLKRKSK